MSPKATVVAPHSCAERTVYLDSAAVARLAAAQEFEAVEYTDVQVIPLTEDGRILPGTGIEGKPMRASCIVLQAGEK